MNKLPILILETAPSMRTVLESYFKHNDRYEAILAGGVFEAMHQLSCRKPDIMVMNAGSDEEHLPFVSKVLKEFPNTRIIVMSGHENPGTVSRFMAAGAKRFIIKNTGSTSLFNALEDEVQSLQAA